MEKVKVREIGQTLTGYAFDSNYFNNKDGFPIIRIRDLRTNSTQTYFNGPFDPKYVVSKGDLLIGMDGEFNLVEWSSKDALLNQRVCKLIIDEQKADRTYIKHALPKKLKDIEDATPFVTVKHLSNKQVLEIELPLPCRNTQKEIAQILEEADIARQKRKAANALTDQFLQTTFLSMFGDPLSNEKNWKTEKLENVSIINPRMNGERELPDEYEVSFIPMASVSDIDGKIVTSEFRAIKDVKKGFTFFKEKDVLFAKITPCMENGKAAIANELKNGIGFGSTEFHVIRCSEMILPEYIFSIIRMPRFRDQAERNMTGSAGQKRVPTTFLKEFVVPIPPISLQKKFASIVADTEQLRQKQKQNEMELENLFQSLLQKYFG